MKSLKITALALSVLALSSAAMAHGRGHAYGHHRRHDKQQIVVVSPRWEARYATPRCEYVRPVVYVPARQNSLKIVTVQPGVTVKLAFGF